MSTAEHPNSSPSNTEPREPEKTCVALTPSTTLAILVEERPFLPDGAAQTFVVDLAALGSGALGGSRKDDRKSTPAGEHQIDDSHSPPSPHEPPGKNHLPPPHVDLALAELCPTVDFDSVDTPTEPPGLPRPINDAAVTADETVLSTVEEGDIARTESSCFSLSGLETLRIFIPDDLLPDDLLVHDPDNLTNLRTDESQSQSDMPIRYVRIFPQTSREGGTPQEPACADGSPTGSHPVRVAHLYLKDDNMLGGGHHSSVYSAPLRLRLDAESDDQSTVRVAVKTAFAQCGAHEMLRREAVAYHAFPRHLMEDRYAMEPPQNVASASDDVAQPETESGPDATATQSASDDASTDVGDKCTHTPHHEPAVVPKFFQVGYYAPVDADGSVIKHSHRSCSKDGTCRVSWPTRLLVVEECGKPVVLEEHTLEQRHLFKRLHAAGFTQGSIYARNLLVQPGPLSAPPEERSDDTPSFRIIDFGRVRMHADLSPGSEGSFSKACIEEEEWANDVLVELCEW
ncbi:hypothetical protein LXA43DRAFT_1093331 [Ganoderma leucocontextum]|nr:hypothetical protein LXA43DRAFT_1093331 [Ganoderma leucocontextum]